MKALQLLFHNVQLIIFLLCCCFIVNISSDSFNSSRSSSNRNSINVTYTVSSDDKIYDIGGSYQPLGMRIIIAG